MADLTGMMQAAAGAAGEDANFIEDVFSTYLYTGNGSTQTITNDIDLDGEGGLVWIKNRGGLGESRKHILVDTVRGGSVSVSSDSTAGNDAGGAPITFLSNGFSIDGDDGDTNRSPGTYASWTFRKQPKFFDVVTWTGNGSNRTIAHNLGSVPGSIIIKNTSDAANWVVYHRQLNGGVDRGQWYINLNTTDAQDSNASVFNNTAPTDTTFSVGTAQNVNSNGQTYVAYLFAHDAGGFGDDGEQNVISCGSYTGAGTVDLGYEPQWVMYKRTESTGSWYMNDTMRGFPVSGNQAFLYANSSDAESSGGGLINLTSTGFTHINAGSYIYIAIRRGPMKVPTTGTSVFTPLAYTGNSGTQTVTTGFPVDAMIEFERTNSSGVPSAGEKYMTDRLRGSSAYLETSSTNSESTGFVFGLTNNTGVALSTDFNTSPRTYIIEAFRRAPGFFDEVCYTGTGSARTVAHNLAAVPELMIVKNRDEADAWQVYAGDATDYLVLNTTAATADNVNRWNDTAPTASVFTIGTAVEVNTSAEDYVAYLFASLAGVSKVGSYTGNGSSVTVTTGFQPRFILVKRTDSTGDWIVGDSARGLVAGDDPFLLLNSNAAETTNQDWVDVSATGFTVNETAANANVNTGTYLYLAIS
jgi:hypothetical protein